MRQENRTWEWSWMGGVPEDTPWDDLFRGDQPLDKETFCQWFRQQLGQQTTETDLTHRYQDYLEDMKPRWAGKRLVNYAQYRKIIRATEEGAGLSEKRMHLRFLGQDEEYNTAQREAQERVERVARRKRNRRRTIIIVLILLIFAVFQTAMSMSGIILGGIPVTALAALETYLIVCTVKGKFDKES